MSAIVAFDFNAPAVVQNQGRRVSAINQDAITGAGSGFPVLSIKGKNFTLVKDKERKVLTRKVVDDDGNEEVVPISNLNLAVVRANARSRVFYAKTYVEGADDGTKPTCMSGDGKTPDANVDEPQSASCQTCPHAVWGTGQGGKGTACSVNTRLAVVDPKYPTTRFLLRVPAGSRANFNEQLRRVDAHGKDYNEAAFRVSFDPEAPTPKLVFELKGLLATDVAAQVAAAYDDPLTLDIVGLGAKASAPRAETPAPTPAPAPALSAPPAPAPARRPAVIDDDEDSGIGDPAPAPDTKPAATRVAKPAVVDNGDDLMSGLTALLGAKDD